MNTCQEIKEGQKTSETDECNNPTCPAKKRRKTIYTDAQVQYLEQMFLTTKYPCKKKYEAIGFKIDLPEGKVRNWFQNRRAREKRQIKRQQEKGLTGQPPIASKQQVPYANYVSPASFLQQFCHSVKPPHTTMPHPSRPNTPALSTTNSQETYSSLFFQPRLSLASNAQHTIGPPVATSTPGRNPKAYVRPFNIVTNEQYRLPCVSSGDQINRNHGNPATLQVPLSHQPAQGVNPSIDMATQRFIGPGQPFTPGYQYGFLRPAEPYQFPVTPGYGLGQPDLYQTIMQYHAANGTNMNFLNSYPLLAGYYQRPPVPTSATSTGPPENVPPSNVNETNRLFNWNSILLAYQHQLLLQNAIHAQRMQTQTPNLHHGPQPENLVTNTQRIQNQNQNHEQRLQEESHIVNVHRLETQNSSQNQRPETKNPMIKTQALETQKLSQGQGLQTTDSKRTTELQTENLKQLKSDTELQNKNTEQLQADFKRLSEEIERENGNAEQQSRTKDFSEGTQVDQEMKSPVFTKLMTCTQKTDRQGHNIALGEMAQIDTQSSTSGTQNKGTAAPYSAEIGKTSTQTQNRGILPPGSTELGKSCIEKQHEHEKEMAPADLSKLGTHSTEEQTKIITLPVLSKLEEKRIEGQTREISPPVHVLTELGDRAVEGKDNSALQVTTEIDIHSTEKHKPEMKLADSLTFGSEGINHTAQVGSMIRDENNNPYVQPQDININERGGNPYVQDIDKNEKEDNYSNLMLNSPSMEVATSTPIKDKLHCKLAVISDKELTSSKALLSLSKCVLRKKTCRKIDVDDLVEDKYPPFSEHQYHFRPISCPLTALKSSTDNGVDDVSENVTSGYSHEDRWTQNEGNVCPIKLDLIGKTNIVEKSRANTQKSQEENLDKLKQGMESSYDYMDYLIQQAGQKKKLELEVQTSNDPTIQSSNLSKFRVQTSLDPSIQIPVSSLFGKLHNSSIDAHNYRNDETYSVDSGKFLQSSNHNVQDIEHPIDFSKTKRNLFAIHSKNRIEAVKGKNLQETPEMGTTNNDSQCSVLQSVPPISTFTSSLGFTSACEKNALLALYGEKRAPYKTDQSQHLYEEEQVDFKTTCIPDSNSSTSSIDSEYYADKCQQILEQSQNRLWQKHAVNDINSDSEISCNTDLEETDSAYSPQYRSTQTTKCTETEHLPQVFYSEAYDNSPYSNMQGMNTLSKYSSTEGYSNTQEMNTSHQYNSTQGTKYFSKHDNLDAKSIDYNQIPKVHPTDFQVRSRSYSYEISTEDVQTRARSYSYKMQAEDVQSRARSYSYEMSTEDMESRARSNLYEVPSKDFQPRARSYSYEMPSKDIESRVRINSEEMCAKEMESRSDVFEMPVDSMQSRPATYQTNLCGDSIRNAQNMEETEKYFNRQSHDMSQVMYQPKQDWRKIWVSRPDEDTEESGVNQLDYRMNDRGQRLDWYDRLPWGQDVYNYGGSQLQPFVYTDNAEETDNEQENNIETSPYMSPYFQLSSFLTNNNLQINKEVQQRGTDEIAATGDFQGKTGEEQQKEINDEPDTGDFQRKIDEVQQREINKELVSGQFQQISEEEPQRGMDEVPVTGDLKQTSEEAPQREINEVPVTGEFQGISEEAPQREIDEVPDFQHISEETPQSRINEVPATGDFHPIDEEAPQREIQIQDKDDDSHMPRPLDSKYMEDAE